MACLESFKIDMWFESTTNGYSQWFLNNFKYIYIYIKNSLVYYINESNKKHWIKKKKDKERWRLFLRVQEQENLCNLKLLFNHTLDWSF